MSEDDEHASRYNHLDAIGVKKVLPYAPGVEKPAPYQVEFDRIRKKYAGDGKHTVDVADIDTLLDALDYYIALTHEKDKSWQETVEGMKMMLRHDADTKAVLSDRVRELEEELRRRPRWWRPW